MNKRRISGPELADLLRQVLADDIPAPVEQQLRDAWAIQRKKMEHENRTAIHRTGRNASPGLSWRRGWQVAAALILLATGSLWQVLGSRPPVSRRLAGMSMYLALVDEWRRLDTLSFTLQVDPGHNSRDRYRVLWHRQPEAAKAALKNGRAWDDHTAVAVPRTSGPERLPPSALQELANPGALERLLDGIWSESAADGPGSGCPVYQVLLPDRQGCLEVEVDCRRLELVSLSRYGPPAAGGGRPLRWVARFNRAMPSATLRPGGGEPAAELGPDHNF